MSALKTLITSLFLVLFSSAVFALTDNDKLFAYVEAAYPKIFTGKPLSGQTLLGKLKYDFRYYKASGNYLTIDHFGEMSMRGPLTNHKMLVIGQVYDLANFVTTWEEKSANPAKEPAHDVGENVFGGLTTPVLGNVVSQTSTAVTYQIISPTGVWAHLVVDKSGKVIASETKNKNGEVITVLESGPAFFVAGDPPRIVSREIKEQAEAGRVVGWQHIHENGTVTHHTVVEEHAGTHKSENGVFQRIDGSAL